MYKCVYLPPGTSNCITFESQRIGALQASTPNHVVAIARPRGRFMVCAHHRFRRRRMSRSSS
jgi:hypothetical protein